MTEADRSCVYCIDSSAIFDAWEDQPPDVFESLWARLDELAQVGRLIAPEEVRQELAYPEALKAWAAGAEFFAELDSEEEQRAVTEVVDRFRSELRGLDIRLRPTDFKADPFVVALARVKGAVVVMHEKRNPDYGRPKMPNIADWYGIRTVRFLEFVREIGFKG